MFIRRHATMTKSLAALFIAIILIMSAEAKKYREWSENFEQMNIGSQWEGSLDHPDLTKIVRTSLRGEETKALEVKYLQNKFGNESRVRYKVSLVNADSYVLEFDLKFGKDFDFKKGGKLPGICGGTCTTGCKNITADGWSSRFFWKSGNNLYLYIYDQDRDRYCGTLYDLNYVITPGKWLKLKKEIKINTANKYDGSVKIWVNDNKLYENLRMRWRGNTNGADINLFYFTTFFGGSTQDWAPLKDSYAYFDNFHIYQPSYHLYSLS